VRLGLKIDVCTYDGLRRGVPNLLRLFERRKVQASFFVALGPDTSGRAVFRLFHPGFLAKMRRTQAVRTYGLRTALSGTVLPARRPYPTLAQTLRDIVSAGHELAVHGYDHRRWQDGLERLSDAEIRRHVESATTIYRKVTGRAPAGFGAPGWQCSAASLRVVDAVGFRYASDTRGRRPFYPRMAGETFRTLQLPTTFPTADEILGVNAIDEEAFVEEIRRGLGSGCEGVLTLHAEMEGRRYLSLAEALLGVLAAEGVTCVPLAKIAEGILASRRERIPVAEIVHRPIRGRAGTVAMPEGWEVP
jgi:undecaprenyl phosphate-alpha-L-ara4FN deformylase